MSFLSPFIILLSVVSAQYTPQAHCHVPASVPQLNITSLSCNHCVFPATTNTTLVVNYNGTLADSGKPFDSSYSPEHPWPSGDPFNFTLGAGQVIKGFDKGLYGVCKHDRRRLRIAPEWAYGEKGAGDGAVPPNATLIFDVEIMSVSVGLQPILDSSAKSG